MGRKTMPLPAEVSLLARGYWERHRRAPRYHCGPATLGQIQTQEPVEIRRGWVLDLSTNGAGLLMDQPLEADTVVVLHVKSTTGERRYELLGRVVHATTQPSGEWLVGCEFADALTPDDLEALL